MPTDRPKLHGRGTVMAPSAIKIAYKPLLISLRMLPRHHSCAPDPAFVDQHLQTEVSVVLYVLNPMRS